MKQSKAEKQLTPIQKAIEKTKADLKEIRILLEGELTADEKSFFEGSAVTMEGFINRLTNSLPAEEQAIIDFAATFNADGYDLEKAFERTFKTDKQ